MARNENKVEMSTPKGVAAWPKLNAPDYGNDKFPNPEGAYYVKMLFDETNEEFIAFREELEAYMPAVEEMAAKKFAALKKPTRDKLGAPSLNPLFATVYDEDDEPTGQVEVKFSMKASGTVKKGPREGQKWTRKPDLFDAFGRKLKKAPAIWGGSELIIAFSFMKDGYFIPATGAYGIKLQLEAAQIVTLRSGGEREASAYGFKAQDGGFDASNMDDEEDLEDDVEGVDDDADEDYSGADY